MLNEAVRDLLNDQVNKEFYSAYLYLEFSNFYEAKGLDGFANWYKVQAQEERDHAMLFYQYLHNNGEQVTLEAIAKPDASLETLMDVLKAGLAHEEYVTSLIHNLYAAAQSSIFSASAAVASGKRFPHHTVFRLVCQRTGRRRKKCSGSDHQNGTVWKRSAQLIYAQ